MRLQGVGGRVVHRPHQALVIVRLFHWTFAEAGADGVHEATIGTGQIDVMMGCRVHPLRLIL